MLLILSRGFARDPCNPIATARGHGWRPGSAARHGLEQLPAVAFGLRRADAVRQLAARRASVAAARRCRAACGRWRPRRPARCRPARAPDASWRRASNTVSASGGRTSAAGTRPTGAAAVDVRARAPASTLRGSTSRAGRSPFITSRPRAGQDDERALARREVDPARRHAAPQQLGEPRLGVAVQHAEGRACGRGRRASSRGSAIPASSLTAALRP